MKNINEQSNRIKQLFTEERLHGNLVESEENILSEQERQKKRYDRGVKRAERKLQRKLRRVKSVEEKEKIEKEFNDKASKLWSAYQENPKAFKMRKLLFKKGEDYKLYGHKDAENSFMLVSLGEGKTADEESKKESDLLIKSYFKVKLGKDNEDIETEMITNDKFKSGKEYLIYKITDLSEIVKKEVSPEDKESTEDKEEVKGKEAAAVGVPSKGDFTQPLKKYGGSQEGYTYELINPKKAVKKDKNGKVVATYIKESKLNRKSLFESVTTFDIKDTIVEAWGLQKADGSVKPFSSSLNTKFEKAIADIDGSVSTTDSSKTSAAKGEVEDTEEVPKGWDNYPCVYKHPNREVKKSSKDGSISFSIDGIEFYNNGRCYDIKTKEKRNYKCNGDDINIVKKDDKKSTDKDDKSVEGNVINNIEVLTGDDSWWDNITHSNLTAALAGPAKLIIAASLPDNIFVDRRTGVKGLVDALDGWVDNEDLSYVGATLNLFKDKRYKDPVSGQLMPAITKIKELYKEDEGEDLIEDIQSVGTNTLSNITLEDGTKVTPDQFKDIIVKILQ
jgi:hypothetical protein